jgi:hypothetical protein
MRRNNRQDTLRQISTFKRDYVDEQFSVTYRQTTKYERVIYERVFKHSLSYSLVQVGERQKFPNGEKDEYVEKERRSSGDNVRKERKDVKINHLVNRCR